MPRPKKRPLPRALTKEEREALAGGVDAIRQELDDKAKKKQNKKTRKYW